MIPASIIEDIRAKADIVQVIESYLPELKKSGRNWRARCPFHNEKTPSFFVSPDKGIYHCFGCGATGDVFKFVQEIEKITWPEAVKKVGSAVGIEVKYNFSDDENNQTPESIERKNIFAALDAAAEIYHKTLFETYSGKNALEYLLKTRSLTLDTIKKFRIGFSEGNILKELSRKHGISEDTILKSGLVKSQQTSHEGNRTEPDARSSDRYYEYMSGRVVFPIRDVRGRTVAFGGRMLDEGRQPKYLNTPESPVYTKGRHLYGFYEGAQRIKKSSEIIIVEGYLDVVVSHQAGIQNAVSCLGTAFTEYHASLINRFVKRVALMFDPDAAGLMAAVRAAENLMSPHPAKHSSLPPEFYVVTLPSGVDPDEYILKNGAREFVDYIRKNKKNFFDFHCDYLISKNGGLISMTPERKLAILHNEIFANIARIGSPLLVQETLKVVSDKLKIPVSAAMAEYSLFLRKNFRSKARSFTKDTPSPDYKNIRQKNYPMPTMIKADDASGVTDGSNQILTREETLAGILLFYPEYAVRFSEDMFCDHKCCFVWKKMLEVYNLRKTAPSGKQPDNNNNVMELFPEDMLGWISSVTLRCPYGNKSADKTALIDEIVDKIYREMEEAMVRKRLDVLKEELQVMLLKGEVDKSKNDEYISLLRRLKVPPSAGSPPSSPSSGTYPKV